MYVASLSITALDIRDKVDGVDNMVWKDADHIVYVLDLLMQRLDDIRLEIRSAEATVAALSSRTLNI